MANKLANQFGLVQERRNTITNALELHLSCTNPLQWEVESKNTHSVCKFLPVLWYSIDGQQFEINFFNENCFIMIHTSLRSVIKVSVDNMSALVEKIAWQQIGDKPLSEPMMG